MTGVRTRPRPDRRAVRRWRRWPVLLPIGVAALTGCGSASPAPDNPAGVVIVTTDNPRGFRGSVTSYEKPDVSLTDTTGATFDLAQDTTSPVTLYFFGYTMCPDICEIVMASISSALRKVDPTVRGQVQVVYVTTDPPRDTPAVIGDYLSRFDFPDVVGLTGAMSDIEAAGHRLGVEIAEGKRLPDGGYEVVHGAHVVGFGLDGTSVLWTQGTAVDVLAHDIELLAAG